MIGVFDGTPTLTVGDIGDTARLMDNDSLDLATVGTYASTPSFQYTGGGDVEIFVSFSASGATQGTATVTITYS